MTARIADEIREFDSSDHETLAIIDKTQKEARKLHKSQAEQNVEPRLLDADSTGFSTG